MTELHFIEIADDVWINAATVARVDEARNGCSVFLNDGSMYRVVDQTAKEFIQRIRGAFI